MVDTTLRAVKKKVDLGELKDLVCQILRYYDLNANRFDEEYTSKEFTDTPYWKHVVWYRADSGSFSHTCEIKVYIFVYDNEDKIEIHIHECGHHGKEFKALKEDISQYLGNKAVNR
nr:hypothetical protein [Candidatus Sigynarchaeota archaeon]